MPALPTPASRGTPLSTAITIVANIVGAGLLSLPYTVATAGPRRSQIYHNTQKMEVFAHIVARLLEEEAAGLPATQWLYLDEFDMTFPWHYDLQASDHTHYGLKDGRALAGVVDSMMLHVALNGLCGRSTGPSSGSS